jgi:hypothetical protein
MLMLIAGLDKAYYNPRVYVVAETDKMSAKRALTCEQEWGEAAAKQVSRAPLKQLLDISQLAAQHSFSIHSQPILGARAAPVQWVDRRSYCCM